MSWSTPHRVPGRLPETPVAWWRRTLDVNVLGIALCLAFLPAMRAGGERRIVNGVARWRCAGA
jgi:NAD(P)-dependent dehydrogenase (short-subunit alcohol dehydrogenase family)